MEKEVYREAFILLMCQRLDIDRTAFDALQIPIIVNMPFSDEEAQVVAMLPLRDKTGTFVASYIVSDTFREIKQRTN